LSYHLLSADLVHFIDPRFNTIWREWVALHHPFLLRAEERGGENALLSSPLHGTARACATSAFLSSWFLHFAGCARLMSLVDTEARSWRACPLPAS